MPSDAMKTYITAMDESEKAYVAAAWKALDVREGQNSYSAREGEQAMTDKPQEPPEPEPYASIEPRGRWTYLIIIHDGWKKDPRSRALGQRHAAAKARRMLRRYLARTVKYITIDDLRN